MGDNLSSGDVNAGDQNEGPVDSTDVPDPREGRPLPNAARAIIPRAKLAGYLVNPGHRDGRHKARVFASALAIGPEDSDYLAGEIRRTLPTEPVVSVNHGAHESTWRVDTSIRGRNGSLATVITAWKIVGGIPRLVTAYVDTGRFRG